MRGHHFSLIPFPDTNIPKIEISGKIARENNILTVHHTITGQTDNILFPKRSAQPGRRDDLWKSTCFEFFLAIPDQPQYWEFNLSPSGDWNTYHMDAYRRVGLREEMLIQRLPFSIWKDLSSIFVNSSVDLSPIVSIDKPIQAGITCVIQTNDGHETYWALVHPNPQADFHSRGSFILALEE